MKSLALLTVLLVVVGSKSFAQTETPPPAPATDEYGIPLKLQSPKKAPAASAAKTGGATTGTTSSSTSSSRTDAYGMPLAGGARAAAATGSSDATQAPARTKRIVKKKDDGLSSAGASGKLVRSKIKPRKSTSEMPQVVAPEVLENQADRELTLQKADLSTGVMPTPATVRSRIGEVRNPVRPLTYRLGLSLQPFQPKGTMSVGDLTPYDASAAGTNPMLAVEGQWLPIKFENTPGLLAGGFVSLGYAQFNLALRSPAGISLDSTRLNVIKVQAGGTVSYQLPKSPLWSIHGNVGLGRLLEIQSASAQYANGSASVLFASLGAAAERSLLPNVSAYAGYDFRLPVDRSTAGADVPMHNVLVGFLGNFE